MFALSLLYAVSLFSQTIISSGQVAHNEGLLFPSPSPQPSRPSRTKTAYYAIQEFKKTVKYAPHDVIDTWNVTNVCEYKGFFCDSFPDDNRTAVAAIDFNGYGLTGDETDGLCLNVLIEGIKELAFFHANSNNFTCEITPQIVNLPFFYELDLSNNKLSGEFPQTLLKMKGLSFLDLRFNGFFGVIPPEVFELDLSVLFLNNNHFSGHLPNNIGSTKAQYLTLANNNLTGTINESIGQASQTLIEILLLNNQLSGFLPYEIGLLENTTVFDVALNNLTGPIPCSFASLKSIEILDLSQNQFYGAVPEEICVLPNLTLFNLSSNYFTSVGLNCMKLANKSILNLEENCIPGLSCQRPKSKCDEFMKNAFRRPSSKEKTMNCTSKISSGTVTKEHVATTAVPKSSLSTAPQERSKASHNRPSNGWAPGSWISPKSASKLISYAALKPESKRTHAL